MDNARVIEMFKVLTELQLREEAIKTYIDYVCTHLIFFQTSSTAQSDKDKFREEHRTLNQTIFLVFSGELSTSGKGRILEVFGGELWYRITVELISRYFKQEYKRFI